MAAPVPDARCLELLSDAAWELARALPFHGHLLAALDRVVDRSIPTAAVGPGRDGRPVLFVNPEFFARSLRRGAERVAVLEHEVLHIALGHLAIEPSVMPDPRRRNLAADLVVNQLVKHTLPKGAITLAMFPRFPRDATCEAYYALLARMADDALPGGDEHASGHGRWNPAHAPSLGAALRDALEDAVAAAHAQTARDGSFAGLSAELQQALTRGRIARGADHAWKRALQLFTQRTLRGGMRATTQRESRRYGTTPHTWNAPIVPGLRRVRRPALAVAIDTSGSIDGTTLTRFFEQVARIAAAGADVHVIECDDAVRRVSRWTGEFPTDVRGRGGTSFDPVIRWMRTEGRQLRLAGCVYLTDGQAPAATERPPCPFLWVITPGGMRVEGLGPCVPMPP